MDTNITRIAVYTAIAGRYDTLKQLPDSWQLEADCIAYIETSETPGWSKRPVSTGQGDHCRNAKLHKIFPQDLFAEYDYSIWMDGSVIPKQGTSPASLIRQALHSHDIALFKHRSRQCVYAEADACIASGKDVPSTILRQMKRYRLENYPEDNGLHECTVLVRRHTPTLVRACKSWLAEIQNGSRRDQLSFNYVIRKHAISCFELPGTIIDNPYFTWLYHDPCGGPLIPVV